MTVGIRFHASIAAALALGILSCLAAASPLRAQSPDDGSWQGTPWEQRMGVPYFEKRAGQGDAEAAYRDAIAADPQYADAHCNLDCVLGARGDLVGAEAAFRAASAGWGCTNRALVGA